MSAASGDGGYSYGQYLAVVISAFVSGSLSMLGSGTILYRVIRKRHTGQIYHRIMGCLSTADLVFSLVFMIQPFVLPSETPRAYFAAGGTYATCSVAAFVTVLSTASVAWYNCVLSLYFLVVVRYNMPHERIRQRLEVPGHCLAVTVPLVMATLGAATKSFGVAVPSPICAIGNYPLGCTTSGGEQEEDDPGNTTDTWEMSTAEECAASPPFPKFLEDLFTLQIVAASLTGFVATFLVYWRVQWQLRRNFDRYHFRGSLATSASNNNNTSSNLAENTVEFNINVDNDNDNDMNAGTSVTNQTNVSASVHRTIFGRSMIQRWNSNDSNDTNPRRVSFRRSNDSNESNLNNTSSDFMSTNLASQVRAEQRDQHQRSIRRVRNQAIAYSLIYFNAALWPAVINITRNVVPDADERSGEPGFFVIMWFGSFLAPLQGALNFLVYIQPQYQRWRGRLPHRSRMWILRQILNNRDIDKIAQRDRQERNRLVQQQRCNSDEEANAVAGVNASILDRQVSDDQLGDEDDVSGNPVEASSGNDLLDQQPAKQHEQEQGQAEGGGQQQEQPQEYQRPSGVINISGELKSDG